MLLRSTIVPTFLLAAFLFQPASVSAQSNDASEMSAEELEQVFKKQKTRGLVLVPTNQEGAAHGPANQEGAAQSRTAHV